MTKKQILAAAAGGGVPILIGYAILSFLVLSNIGVDPLLINVLLTWEGQLIATGVVLAALGGIIGARLLIRSRMKRRISPETHSEEQPGNANDIPMRTAILGGIAGGLVSIPIQICLIAYGSVWVGCYLAKGC